MSRPQPSDEDSLEPTSPVRIGAGSFATIYAVPGRSIVLKVAHSQDHAAQVKAEYENLHSIYTRCNSDSLFAIPRALAFYDPQVQELLFYPPSPGRGRSRQPRKPFSPSFFSKVPPRPCYVMDRVAPLQPDVAEFIHSSMYPSAASDAPDPLICRLYFGEQLRPSASVNPNNFPIDVARYQLLAQQLPNDIPSIEDVAAGMGEMLSRIHWNAGYDARDVEFVMAGAPDSAITRFYILGFNQVHSFTKVNEDVTSLVDVFFSSDPYYPRPIPGDSLYEAFKRAYVRSCNPDHIPDAKLFLQAIEQRQAARAVVV
ncbi:hypothetical protein ACG7TL_007756 [Trametes sanguinea]